MKFEDRIQLKLSDLTEELFENIKLVHIIKKYNSRCFFFCFFNTSINFFPDFFLFPLKTELFEIVQKNLLFSLDKICFL